MKQPSLLKRLENYMGQQKILLPISVIASALSSVLGIAPYIFIWLIARELLVNYGEIAGTAVYTYAWWAFVLAILSIVTYFCAVVSSHVAAFRVERNIRQQTMEKVIQMPLGFFENNTSGRIRKIIDDDTANTHNFLAHQLPDLAASFVLPISTIILIMVFEWRLGLACLVPLVFAFVTMAYMMMGTSREFQRKYMDALEEMSSEAVEYVRGIPVVKVFQQTVYSFKRFHSSIIRYNDLVKKHTDNWEAPLAFYAVIVQAFAFFLIPVAILLIGYGANHTGVIADMFLYVLITPMLSNTIMKSMHISQNFFVAREAIDRIESVADQVPLVQPDAGKTNTRHDVVFEQVSFRYPDTSKMALTNIDLTIDEGQTIALVGPSGSGKSTIAKLIPRFWDVLSGSVKIGGVDVREMRTEYLMRQVSFVFQNARLFKTTIRDNVTYGSSSATDAQIHDALERAQCLDLIKKLPHGIDTLIGSEGVYLSGGEQQRIALARAFLKDAPIVVLDEATAFADPENERLIQQALKQLMKGKTVLMIAHRLTTIQDADRILVVSNGEIIEQGRHQELIEQAGIYQSMWNEYQQAVQWTINKEICHA